AGVEQEGLRLAVRGIAGEGAVLLGDLEAVVVEERLDLLGEELAVAHRRHPGLLAVERVKLHRDEEDLAELVVVEALAVADELAAALARVAEARREVRLLGDARQLLGLGDRD